MLIFEGKKEQLVLVNHTLTLFCLEPQPIIWCGGMMQRDRTPLGTSLNKDFQKGQMTILLLPRVSL